jgi:hypothetical protein
MRYCPCGQQKSGVKSKTSAGSIDFERARNERVLKHQCYFVSVAWDSVECCHLFLALLPEYYSLDLAYLPGQEQTIVPTVRRLTACCEFLQPVTTASRKDCLRIYRELQLCLALSHDYEYPSHIIVLQFFRSALKLSLTCI